MGKCAQNPRTCDDTDPSTNIPKSCHSSFLSRLFNLLFSLAIFCSPPTSSWSPSTGSKFGLPAKLRASCLVLLLVRPNARAAFEATFGLVCVNFAVAFMEGGAGRFRFLDDGRASSLEDIEGGARRLFAGLSIAAPALSSTSDVSLILLPALAHCFSAA